MPPKDVQAKRAALKEALLRSQGRTLAKSQATTAKGQETKAVVVPKPPGKGRPTPPATTTTAAAGSSSTSTKTTGAIDAPGERTGAPLTDLQRAMARKLAGAEFRWLNERLYTTPSQDSFSLFQSRPDMFHAYHTGFRAQVEAWPANPVDGFIRLLRSYPPSTIVADLGCGEGRLGLELAGHLNTIHSFDLVSPHPGVIACDMAALPLADQSVDVAVFCLSLMGTNFLDFLREAHRILRPQGELHIAEVVSRFPEVEAFTQALCDLGFQLCGKVDRSNKMFVRFHLRKRAASAAKVEGVQGGMEAGTAACSRKRNATTHGKVGKAGTSRPLDASSSALLRPCVYKKR